jgi:hypothetical protein
VKKACSFLKKRTKKLLHFSAMGASPFVLTNKSFLLLFFKKDVLAFFAATGRLNMRAAEPGPPSCP